jgi:2-keto-4-pentenoate hydratase
MFTCQVSSVLGGTPPGHKIGATSPDVQAFLQRTHPIHAPVLRQQFLQSGVRFEVQYGKNLL